MNVMMNKASFERALANGGLSKINDRQRRAIFAKGGRPGAENADSGRAYGGGGGGGGPSVTGEQQRRTMTLPASSPDLPRVMVTTTAPIDRDVTPGANYAYRKPYPDQAPPYRPPEMPAKPAPKPPKPGAPQHETGLLDPTQHIKDIFKIYTDAAKNPSSSGMLLAPRPPTKKK